MENRNISGETTSTSTSTIEVGAFSSDNKSDENLSSTGGFKNVVCKPISSFEEAYPNIEINFPNWIIGGVYQIDTGYIFTIVPVDMEKDSYVLGAFYKICKNNCSVEGYSPVMNPEEFKEALNNRIK